MATSGSLALFYTGARLTYHLSRDTILPRDTIDARFLYIKDNSRLTVPTGTDIRLDIQSIRDKAGVLIDPSRYSEYLTIAPNPTTLTENGALYVLTSRDQL